ncbi:MAG TPA: PadR family transcriptional regulator, partial [Acidimicrobiales bacterium]|nr:PadR family transcriptional regulator [Acidimicrobiales bacterium]
MSPVFEHGALRLYLLLLLEDGPHYGYELMRMLEDRFMGMYTPSAGTIYPRLAALEDDGFVAHDIIDGRKVYRLTDAGRAELDARRDEVDAVAARAAQSAREMAREVRDEVRASVRDIRRELKDAVRDVRREERRAREVRDADALDWIGDDAARVTRDTAREVGRVAREAARQAARAGLEAARTSRRADREVTARDLTAHDQTTREVRDVFRSLRA